MTASEKGFLIMPAIRLDRSPYAGEFDEARRLIDEISPCGFIVFGGEADEVRRITADLESHAGRKMLFGADLERGAGQQFRGLSDIQTPMAIAACKDADKFAFEAGRCTAIEALSVGINLLFAPVCDVNTEPKNPIINVRSFSDDPDVVSSLVIDWINGAQGAGALACAKHFPGHGGTWADSHIELPIGVNSKEELKSKHLPPFYAAVGAGVASIMTGHITVPALGEKTTPATLSPNVIRDLLRNSAGYDGIVITDALLMKGLVIDETIAAVKALKAGCDILLYPTSPRDIYKELDSKILDIGESVRRIERAIESVGRNSGPAPKVDSRDLSRRIAAESPTLVDGETIRPEHFIIHAPPDRFDVSIIRDALAKTGAKEITLATIDRSPGEILLAVFSYPAAWKKETFPDLSLLGDALTRTGIVSFGDPYFLLRNGVGARYRICAYDGHDETQKAVAEILSGACSARGKLPIRWKPEA